MSEQTAPLTEVFESLGLLLATNSRDWGAQWDDAWLWAVLCGWDCEQAEHDGSCTHGAMEEMAAKFGWDAETVAKLRRYRAAVRAASAGLVRPGEEPDAVVALDNSEARFTPTRPLKPHYPGEEPTT